MASGQTGSLGYTVLLGVVNVIFDSSGDNYSGQNFSGEKVSKEEELMFR